MIAMSNYSPVLHDAERMCEECVRMLKAGWSTHHVVFEGCIVSISTVPKINPGDTYIVPAGAWAYHTTKLTAKPALLTCRRRIRALPGLEIARDSSRADSLPVFPVEPSGPVVALRDCYLVVAISGESARI